VIPRASEHATERREAREEDSSRPRQARRLHSRRRGAGTAASNGAEVIRAKHRRQDRAQRDERKATKTTIQERRQGDSQSERVHARQSELSRRGGNSQSEQAREREARGERGRRQPSTPSQASTLQAQAERACRPRPRPRPRPRAAAAGRSSAPPPRAFGMRPARGSSPVLSMRYLSGTTTPFFNIERASA